MADDVRALLREALDEYLEHQSWRCEHPPHFYLANREASDKIMAEEDCYCGLLGFQRRAREALDGPENSP